VKTGGIFRIDDAGEPGNAKCTAVKIAAVERPSAMAFGPDGILYITTFGESEKPRGGKLLKITGEL
jgi:hypothetical protein